MGKWDQEGKEARQGWNIKQTSVVNSGKGNFGSILWGIWETRQVQPKSCPNLGKEKWNTYTLPHIIG